MHLLTGLVPFNGIMCWTISTISACKVWQSSTHNIGDESTFPSAFEQTSLHSSQFALTCIPNGASLVKSFVLKILSEMYLPLASDQPAGRTWHRPSAQCSLLKSQSSQVTFDTTVGAHKIKEKLQGLMFTVKQATHHGYQPINNSK